VRERERMREGGEDGCKVCQVGVGVNFWRLEGVTSTEKAWFKSFSLSVSRFFSSVRAVLQGACHMVAMQISAEPLVRQALRQVFQSRAVLNVKPTKKGKKVWHVLHVTPA
jgi:transcriptional accessory protein Tex/SPT6